MEHFLQAPIASAREWWYNALWKDEANKEDEEDLEDLKQSDDCGENVVVLKVGIHCEECKRIVADALWSMSGVDRVDIDKMKQKVTVSGRVNPQRVLRRARRTGKIVEFWKTDSAAPASDSYAHSSSSTLGGLTAEEEEEVASCSIM